MLRPEYFMVMCKGHHLSPQGTLPERSMHGQTVMCAAKGAGVVVLKPLSAALRDNDPIYAVIRATGVNQDGFRRRVSRCPIRKPRND